MGNKLVIGSSGQIGVELIEQLSKIHGPNNVVASDIKPRLKNKIKGWIYHKKMTSRFIVCKGKIKFAFFNKQKKKF